MIPSQNHYNAIPCSSSCIGAYHNACTIYCDSVTAQYCMPLCHIRHAGLPFHTESYTILPYTILTYIMGPFIEILSYHIPSYLYTMYHLKYNIIPYTFMLSTPFLIYTILSYYTILPVKPYMPLYHIGLTIITEYCRPLHQ